MEDTGHGPTQDVAEDNPASNALAGVQPCALEVQAGRSYSWCACGLSNKRPLCDGSHRDTDIKSLRFTADKDEIVWLCMCRKTLTPPFCDGSHEKND